MQRQYGPSISSCHGHGAARVRDQRELTGLVKTAQTLRVRRDGDASSRPSADHRTVGVARHRNGLAALVGGLVGGKFRGCRGPRCPGGVLHDGRQRRRLGLLPSSTFRFFSRFFSVEARDGVGERHVVARQAPRARLYRRRAPLQRGQVVRVRGRRRRRCRFRRAARLRNSRPRDQPRGGGRRRRRHRGRPRRGGGRRRLHCGLDLAVVQLPTPLVRAQPVPRDLARLTTGEGVRFCTILHRHGIAVAPPQSRK
mmetsp:Transcript_19802/g.56238  ORF Transcript_19802/g.56238 Transcript_19802/m.56238 type:complete len:254 (+) Transcript_19802:369-1130(+)